MAGVGLLILRGLKTLIIPGVKVFATSSAEETSASRMTLPDRIILRNVLLIILIALSFTVFGILIAIMIVDGV